MVNLQKLRQEVMDFRSNTQAERLVLGPRLIYACRTDLADTTLQDEEVAIRWVDANVALLNKALLPELIVTVVDFKIRKWILEYTIGYLVERAMTQVAAGLVEPGPAWAAWELTPELLKHLVHKLPKEVMHQLEAKLKVTYPNYTWELNRAGTIICTKGNL